MIGESSSNVLRPESGAITLNYKDGVRKRALSYAALYRKPSLGNHLPDRV